MLSDRKSRQGLRESHPLGILFVAQQRISLLDLLTEEAMRAITKTGKTILMIGLLLTNAVLVAAAPAPHPEGRCAYAAPGECYCDNCVDGSLRNCHNDGDCDWGICAGN